MGDGLSGCRIYISRSLVVTPCFLNRVVRLYSVSLVYSTTTCLPSLLRMIPTSTTGLVSLVVQNLFAILTYCPPFKLQE